MNMQERLLDNEAVLSVYKGISPEYKKALEAENALLRQILNRKVAV